MPCCFKAPVRKEGQRIVTRFQLQDDIEEEICSNDPWIILHKIDSPTKMRYIGSKVASCNKTQDSTAVAPSIAAWVKQKGDHLASLRKASISKPEGCDVMLYRMQHELHTSPMACKC